ncbi:MAG: preprotein translocase subunit SecY [Anaerovoracaceae bacterium]|nr:preprotein translocase subunit SecY [Anaerovoracaceae bacterium]
MGMLKTVAQAWKVAEIRSKMIFTLLMLVVFRIGSNIPVPNINRSVLADLFAGETGLFDLFDLFSGGSFSNFTIFALSITPYITASIIIQLLGMAFPYFEKLAREGVEGRKKMAQYTRYLTIVLALVQAIGLTVGLFRKAVVDKSAFSIIVMVLVLTAGTAFLMWLGEQINDRGIGNGISLIIFAGIVARIPSGIRALATAVSTGSLSIVTLIIFIVAAVLVTAGVVLIQEGQRRIPVQYAKRVVGRKMYGGQSTHIPIKVNQAGVIPIIFALSLLQFPLTITYFLKADSGFTAFVTQWLSPSGMPGVWVYGVLNVILIIFFTYFYTQATFNPSEVADNMKANGGFIPGIRPGKATEEYLQKVMSRITIVGAVFLAVIATLPTILSVIAPESLGSIHFGGTSLLIAVGVALETVRQLENQMLMRNYQGFLK